jgi:hypothetical protein
MTMPNIIRPAFNPDSITAARMISKTYGSNPNMQPVLDMLVKDVAEIYPKAKGYDPDEVYLHYIPEATRWTRSVPVPAIFYHEVNYLIARLIEINLREDVWRAAGVPSVVIDDETLTFDIDEELVLF